MNRFFALILLALLVGCSESSRPLPILGNPEMVDGKPVYPVIPNFAYLNQDGEQVTLQTLDNQIYVADFIFLSCPTICPKMTKEMLAVYQAFLEDPRVTLISYSIDPDRDSVPRLKDYTRSLGVSSPKWHFLTGNRDSIMQLAEQSYFSTAYADSSSPGGFTHSGGLMLIDKNRHLRGLYDGTNPEETKELIQDIKVLLKEQ